MSKELWLEFGNKTDDRWEDVYWYNEGRWQELPYFLRNLFRRLFTRKPSCKMYYKVRYGKKGFTFVI